MGRTTESKEESEDTCVICLSLVTERAVTVPCNHYNFDFVCLISWLQERSTCPLCKLHAFKTILEPTDLVSGKTETTAVQYDWRSPDEFESYSIRRTHACKDESTATRQHGTSPFAPYGFPSQRRCTRRLSPPLADDSALYRRKEIYQKKLYSLHVGSNSYSGYRDLTPQMIARDSELQSRARTWIRRELRVFSFLYTDPSIPAAHAATTSNNAEFLLSYVVSILKKVDIKASNGHAEDLLIEFLGREHSKLFLHELQSWLRSPYTKLQDWDGEVQYAE